MAISSSSFTSLSSSIICETGTNSASMISSKTEYSKNETVVSSKANECSSSLRTKFATSSKIGPTFLIISNP